MISVAFDKKLIVSLFLVVVVTLSYQPWNSRPFMLAALRNNMTDFNYVYIIPFSGKNNLVQPDPWTQNEYSTIPSNVSDNIAKQAYINTYIVIIAHVGLK